MACSEAPVAQRAFHDDRVRYGTRVGFLGIIGDTAHQGRTSSHNCAPRQESPVGGVRYHPGYAHALDVKVFGDRALGLEIVNARCHDPRVRYCIFQAVIYYGIHYRPGPNGTILTGKSSGHPDHVHTSFLPGTTFDTSPFYQNASDEEFDMDAVTEIKNAVLVMGVKVLEELADTEERLLRAEWKTRRAVKDQDATDDALAAAVDDIAKRLDEGTAKLKADLGID